MAEIAIRNYLNDVSKNIICSRSQKAQFISSLSADIDDFVDGRDEISSQDLAEEFGTPEEVAAAFAAQVKQTELKNKLSKKKIAVIAVVAGIILAAIAIFVGYKCYQRWEFFAHPDGYIAETPVYVVDEEQIEDYFDSLRDSGAKVY